MCKAVVMMTIPSLVRLRRTVRRWRSRAARAATGSSSSSPLRPAGNKQLMERADADAAKNKKKKTVPAGHVALRVEGGGGSSSSRRFVVRLAHLNHPAFRELLRQAEEEYGFPTAASGPIALPCDEDHFLDVLHRVSSSSNKAASSSSCCCCGSGPTPMRRAGESRRPLLQGMMSVERLVW